MPSGPRKISRGRGGTGDPKQTTSDSQLAPAALPKHFPFPNTPTDSDVMFDFLMALFGTCGAGFQFLHLYRSIWWLPQSYTKSTMNFYLVDKFLLIFILAIIWRRMYYYVGSKLISKVYPSTCLEDFTGLSRNSSLILTFLYASMVGTLAVVILGMHPKKCILYICTPFVYYSFFFEGKLKPYFDLSSWCSNGIPVIHACSTNPHEIRRECEHLKNNFNDRMKQIMLTSLMNAYFGGLIPCCFAQKQVIFDFWWCILHTFFIFSCSYIYSVAHLFPLRYCDIMHRAALHLGAWENLENGRNLSVVDIDWRDDLLWPFGVLVKYDRTVWRALGDCNASRPGDDALTKFYKVFFYPSHAISMVLFMGIIVVFLQLYLLMKVTQWYKIISLTIMLFFNYYPLYKICRDFWLSYRIYKHSEHNDEERHAKRLRDLKGAENNNEKKTKDKSPLLLNSFEHQYQQELVFEQEEEIR